MVAALLYVPQGGFGLGWWLLALLVLAAGVGPFGSWVRATPQRATVTQYAAVLLIASVIGTTVYADWCAACQGCDPWWLEHFWICWPSN